MTAISQDEKSDTPIRIRCSPFVHVISKNTLFTIPPSGPLNFSCSSGYSLISDQHFKTFFTLLMIILDLQSAKTKLYIFWRTIKGTTQEDSL